MKYLFLGVFVALGMLVSQASAQCLGCGHQGMPSGPIQCDYSGLWNGFSPSQHNYSPDCWSGGCGKGCMGGHFIGFLDRMRAHATGYGGCGCGIACGVASPDIGWASIGHGVGDPGVDGYGGNALSSFHGLSQAGCRLMGNRPCCPARDCFAGPCASNSCGTGACGVGGGLGCHSFQTGCLGGLMERLRNHCSGNAYSNGCLDSCGTLGGGGRSYPAGNLDLNFGGASCGCGNGGCNGNCGDGGLSYPGGESVIDSFGTPEPEPISDEPHGASDSSDPPEAFPSAGQFQLNRSPFEPAPTQYPRTGARPWQQSSQPSFRSRIVPEKSAAGFGSSQGQLDFVSLQR